MNSSFKKIQRGGPLDKFFHQFLSSHWSKSSSCDQMLASDWGIGDLIQRKPLLEMAVIKNMKHQNINILRQIYKYRNLYILPGGGGVIVQCLIRTVKL